MLAWVDVLSERVVELHEQERRAWARSGEAVRADTIRDLLDGAPVDLRLAESRLGYPLARTHRCVVGWCEAGGEQQPDHGRLAADVAAALGARRSVSFAVDRETVAVWAIEAEEGSGAGAGGGRGSGGGRGPRGGATGDPLAAVAADGVSIAVGRAHAGLDGFRWAHREAMHARRVALLERRPPGAVVRYEQVALQALASADPEHARRFVAWQLGPLAGGDPASRVLAETVRSYLLHESNLRAAAADLGIHHNTVANRLRRASELLGGPLAGRGAELLMALALLDATRDGAARTRQAADGTS
nr:helix-turn-helix domain-containing protein [Conexibacter arvalis]